MTKVHKVHTTSCSKQKCWGQEPINGGLLLRGQWSTTAVRPDVTHNIIAQACCFSVCSEQLAQSPIAMNT